MKNVLLNVPFIAQIHDWDCGIACTQMVCKFLGFREEIDFVLNGDDPRLVWTIDLAHYFSKLNVRHCMYTEKLSVEPRYKGIEFYNKYDFNEEEMRINNLFNNVNEHNISVKKKHVSLEEIVHHLETSKQPIIVLVDASVLYNVTSCCHCIFSKQEYQGHFIVVIGYEADSQSIIFHNPGHDKGAFEKCDELSFEKARKSDGTDQDILFIFDLT